MGDKPESKGGVWDWVKNLSAFVLGAIALIKGVSEFVKLFQGSDAELITWIILIACITVLCAISLYYARFWQPEKDDKSTLVLHLKQTSWSKNRPARKNDADGFAALP